MCVGGGGVSVGVLYNPVWAPVALCCTPTYERCYDAHLVLISSILEQAKVFKTKIFDFDL